MEDAKLQSSSVSAASPGGNVPDTDAGDPYKRPQGTSDVAHPVNTEVTCLGI